jgi:lipopolysaccharide/colanic/teichoic acid biosynthesis glycosyltransferase
MKDKLIGLNNWGTIDTSKIKKNYLTGSTKKAMDIFGSLVGIFLFWPLMLIAMAIIKLFDRVPALFIQPRYGMNGNSFLLHKLKTMTIVENAKMLTLDKMQNKPRVEQNLTKTGKFWRETSIDELPQFIDVILGNMSIVGYRPFPFYYIEKWKELPGLKPEILESYLQMIAKFKPGVTSLSSIKGRSNLTLQEKMEYDLLYAKHANIWLDIKIILATVIVVLTREGAR